jgi:metal-responsive CopG/Arc/MetJ family transcriptional regulator
MKTAISLPEEVFNAAERHARRIGISRSRLYAVALSEYLKAQQRKDVKQVLDRVYSSQPSSVDPILDAMQQASSTQEDW